MICGNIILKMQLLKARANKVLRYDSLRHIPNEHDIKECSDNTRIIDINQQKTINKWQWINYLVEYTESDTLICIAFYFDIETIILSSLIDTISRKMLHFHVKNMEFIE